MRTSKPLPGISQIVIKLGRGVAHARGTHLIVMCFDDVTCKQVGSYFWQLGYSLTWLDPEFLLPSFHSGHAAGVCGRSETAWADCRSCIYWILTLPLQSSSYFLHYYLHISFYVVYFLLFSTPIKTTSSGSSISTI